MARIQIAKFETGADDEQKNTVVVEHDTSDGQFKVSTFETIDGEQALGRTVPFKSPREAFDHAQRLLAADIDDVVEILEG